MIGIIVVCLLWWSCLIVCYSWMMIMFLVEGGLFSESGAEMVGSMSLAQFAVFFI